MLTWDEEKLPRLHYPLPGEPRIAVLGLAVRGGAGIRCFPKWTCHQIMRARPEALAGPLADLLEVARLRDGGYLPGLDIQLPLVVFSSLGSGVMTGGERTALWHAYGLPFFEQVRDREGRLLAYECEARQGFHFVGEETGRGLPRPQRCACGLAAPARKAVFERTRFAEQAMTGR